MSKSNLEKEVNFFLEKKEAYNNCFKNMVFDSAIGFCWISLAIFKYVTFICFSVAFLFFIVGQAPGQDVVILWSISALLALFEQGAEWLLNKNVLEKMLPELNSSSWFKERKEALIMELNSASGKDQDFKGVIKKIKRATLLSEIFPLLEGLKLKGELKDNVLLEIKKKL